MKPRSLHQTTTQAVLKKLHLDLFPNYKQIIHDQFTQFEPLYPAQHKIAERKYNRIREKIARTEKRFNKSRLPGQEHYLYTSRHQRIQARWYLNLTADFRGFREQIQKIEESLRHPDQPQYDTWQDPETGAFGSGYNLFHLKCDAMIDAIGTLYNNGNCIPPQYPLHFLRPINSGEKIVNYLKPLMVSDILKTGVNHRDQIGAITGSMSQLVYKSYLRDYVNKYVDGLKIDDAYVDQYTKFLDDWQDPITGFWGEWYNVNGQIFKSPDLSLTYHTVKYRKGQINHWNELIDTLLAIKNQPYPFGWAVRGHMNNHNSMDVVRIMKLGWEYMTEPQRDRCRRDIFEMLEWCLKDSLEPDGSFRFLPFYNSWGDAFYYGVAFLDTIGYINPENIFWTDKKFPEGAELCKKIKSRLLELGLNNVRAISALKILRQDCSC